MTKVIPSQSIFEYRQAMASRVEQVRREKTIAGVEPSIHEDYPPRRDEISCEPRMAGLLKPPMIESLFTDFRVRDGGLKGVILVWTSGAFGVMNVYVIVSDEHRNVVESGYAMRNPFYMNNWGYFLERDAGPYRTLTVRAIAMDSLGGTGIESESTEIQ